ncbi:MAG: hypothetical protein ABSB09_05430 [Acidimicrobiales bacterium]|jgi:hypothetical protein
MVKDEAKQAKGSSGPEPGEPLGLQWLDDVAAHDFDAAQAYLSLKLDERQAEAAVGRLRKAEVTHRRANDILRACSLVPLPLDDPGVRRDLLKAVSGKKLSPVLVVSTDHGGDIADGYHRVSLAYHLDPFGDVPLRIGAAPT